MAFKASQPELGKRPFLESSYLCGILPFNPQGPASQSQVRIPQTACSASVHLNLCTSIHLYLYHCTVFSPQAWPPSYERYQKVDGGAFEVEPDPSTVKFFDRDRGRTFIHPGSVCFKTGKYDSGFVVYTSMTQTSKLFVREGEIKVFRFLCTVKKHLLAFPRSINGTGLFPVAFWWQSYRGCLCWATLGGWMG